MARQKGSNSNAHTTKMESVSKRPRNTESQSEFRCEIVLKIFWWNYVVVNRWSFWFSKINKLETFPLSLNFDINFNCWKFSLNKANRIDRSNKFSLWILMTLIKSDSYSRHSSCNICRIDWKFIPPFHHIDCRTIYGEIYYVSSHRTIFIPSCICYLFYIL